MSGFTMPSATLLAQSVLSGVFVGALYGLLGLGLSLSWGLLRLINLAHFAFAFLAAYLCYQLAHDGRGPAAVAGADRAAVLRHRRGAALGDDAASQITPFNSLLVTFGLTGIVEALIQTVWTADFRKLESRYGEERFKIVGLYVPLPELITLGLAVALVLRGVGRAALHRPGQGAARVGRGCADRRRLRHQPAPQCAAAGRHLLGAGQHGRRVPGAGLHAGAVADLCLDRRGLRRGDARRAGPRAGAAGRRHRHRRQRGRDDGGDRAVVGAAGVVHAADRHPAVAPGRAA